MPANPDLPRFIPDATGESVGIVMFREMQPGVEYDIQDQPHRERVVIRTPEPKYALVGVHFLKDEKHPDSEPNANLRELVLKGTGVNEAKLAAKLKRSGVAVIASPPRYPNKPAVTINRAEEMQDEDITNHWPRLFPDTKVIQPRRPEPDPASIVEPKSRKC